MRRRNYIGVLGATSMSLISGCAGDGAISEETTTKKEPPEFQVTNNTPDSADIGEPVEIEFEVENTGGQGGTWEAEYSDYASAGSEPAESDFESYQVSLYVAAGESRTWASKPVTYERPAVLYYRLDGGSTQTVEVPDSHAPIIEETNLVSEWQSFGDVTENSISEAEAGSTVNIAAKYWYWIEGNTNNSFKQVEVYDENDDRIGIQTTSGEQVTERNGWQLWESSLSLDTTGWGEGTYTAQFLIRDNQNSKASNTGTVEFELL